MGSHIMSHNLFLYSWLGKERQRVTYNAAVSSTLTTTAPSNNFRGREFIFDWRRTCIYARFEPFAILLSTFAVNSSPLAVTATLPRSVGFEIGDLGLRKAGALFDMFDRDFGQMFS